MLAVNTAGMLVRRRVLEELGGFDDELPIFGNDIDFGWRAAQAGHRTIVIPQAVVFHAEAAHRGVRRTPLTGRHTHYQERRAALFTLLANAPGRALPWQVVRLFLGSLLRVLGFLVVRSVGRGARRARRACCRSTPAPATCAPPAGARADRRGPATPTDVRRCSHRAWLPYRHGLDFVTDLAAAATNQAAGRRRASPGGQRPPPSRPRRAPRVPLGRRRGGRVPPGLRHRGPVRDQPGRRGADPLRRARDRRRPSGLRLDHRRRAVAGARATPRDWWRLHVEARHPLGTGTDVPAPAVRPAVRAPRHDPRRQRRRRSSRR